MDTLMNKLAVSKAIMDKHKEIQRGQSPQNSSQINYNIDKPEVEEFQTPDVRYNIPQEYISESKPIRNTNTEAPKDRILNSKLPDEIKRLMIENPIVAQNPMSPSNSVLTDELVEKASRLMGTNRKEQPVVESKQTITQNNDLRKMMKEVVKEVLKENGLILESTSNTNETMVIKVGQHIFEGKISKIKKLK
jgi:hypothetical protein